MKHILCLIAVLTLTACGKNEPEPTGPRTWYYDQETRERIFLMCLSKLPAGPQTANFNDWNEVVSECAESARAMSAVGEDSNATYRRAPTLDVEMSSQPGSKM